MAKESKSISVLPSEEQSTIQVYQTFGWELQSSQEIFNRDSHLEKDNNGDINSVTTTTNYVKLVFCRNTEMKNYHQLVDLERRYNNISFPVSKSAKVWFILGLIAAVFGFVNVDQELLIAIPCFVGAAALFVLGIIKKKKNSDAYYSQLSDARKQQQRILNEACNLL